MASWVNVQHCLLAGWLAEEGSTLEDRTGKTFPDMLRKRSHTRMNAIHEPEHGRAWQSGTEQERAGYSRVEQVRAG